MNEERKLIQRVLLSTILLIFIIAKSDYPQATVQETYVYNDEKELLRVFIDCDDCDFENIRQEINYINYVREPELAQVYILGTCQETGGGGKLFKFSFTGKERFSKQNILLPLVSNKTDTKDEVNKEIIRALKSGLLPYLYQTSIKPDISIKYKNASVENSFFDQTDSWDNWVFSFGVGGSLNSERSKKSYSIENEIEARKITDEWKLENNYSLQYSEERFEDDGKNISSYQRENQLQSKLVKSISNKWSAGISGGLFTSTEENTKLQFILSPAIEYNFYPWYESSRKSITMAYEIGMRKNYYYEETLFDKLSENLTYQSFNFEVKIRESWGELKTSLESYHYFSDLSKYRITFEVDFSIRLYKGFSLEMNLESEKINDQFYLPKGTATIKDILLERRELATTYKFKGVFGLKYTFGSVFNNTVNERL